MAQQPPELLGEDVGHRGADGGLVAVHHVEALGAQREEQGVHGPRGEEEERHDAHHEAAVALGHGVVGLDVHLQGGGGGEEDVCRADFGGQDDC